MKSVTVGAAFSKSKVPVDDVAVDGDGADGVSSLPIVAPGSGDTYSRTKTQSISIVPVEQQ